MRENDVRERVQAFLKNTVRLVVVPASMGIGLALIGCGASDETPQDAGADVVSIAGQSGQSGAGGGGGSSASGGISGSSSAGGSGGFATLYSAPGFDAGAGGSGGLPASHPAYMASLPDAGMSYGGKYAAPMSTTGGMAMKYSAPMSATGGASGGRSSFSGTGGSLPGVYTTYGTPWASSSTGTGGRVGGGGITSAPPSSSGGVPTGGAVPDAGPGFDAQTSDSRTGGTTTPVTRYGGIFPGSSS